MQIHFFQKGIHYMKKTVPLHDIEEYTNKQSACQPRIGTNNGTTARVGLGRPYAAKGSNVVAPWTLGTCAPAPSVMPTCTVRRCTGYLGHRCGIVAALLRQCYGIVTALLRHYCGIVAALLRHITVPEESQWSVHPTPKQRPARSLSCPE